MKILVFLFYFKKKEKIEKWCVNINYRKHCTSELKTPFLFFSLFEIVLKTQYAELFIPTVINIFSQKKD